jgi:hypothetical protein
MDTVAAGRLGNMKLHFTLLCYVILYYIRTIHTLLLWNHKNHLIGIKNIYVGELYAINCDTSRYSQSLRNCYSAVWRPIRAIAIKVGGIILNVAVSSRIYIALIVYDFIFVFPRFRNTFPFSGLFEIFCTSYYKELSPTEATNMAPPRSLVYAYTKFRNGMMLRHVLGTTRPVLLFF